MEASLLSPRRVLTTALRWCTPTPGKFVALLLLSVVVLYLSDRFDWFAFNKQKGWTVLMAVAAVTVGLGLILVWSVGACFLRRRVQFGLLTLLLMVPTMAVPFAWLTREMQKAREITEAITHVDRGGGGAYFTWIKTNGKTLAVVDEPYQKMPAWLLRTFGFEFFGEVRTVFLGDGNRLSDITSFRELQELSVFPAVAVGDADLDAIVDLPQLATISIFESEISDEGLKKLARMTSLKEIRILNSNVTRLGRDDFEKVFAGKCYISLDYRFEMEQLQGLLEVEREVDSAPKYDNPYTLEYRSGSNERALQEAREAFKRSREEYLDGLSPNSPESDPPCTTEPNAVDDPWEI